MAWPADRQIARLVVATNAGMSADGKMPRNTELPLLGAKLLRPINCDSQASEPI